MEQSTIVIAAIIAIIVIFILSRRSTVEYFTPPTTGNWKKIPGALRNITVSSPYRSADGTTTPTMLCGTNQGNQMWCLKDIDNPQWERMDTTSDVLEVAMGGKVCVLDTANNIYCGR